LRAAGAIMRRIRLRLLGERWVQKLIVPFGRELAPQKWVFIVGCYNSGTRLLAEILGHHPKIAGTAREGVILTDVLSRPESFGWPRMWCRCVDRIRLDPAPGMDRVARRIKRQWSFSFADRPVVVEKSIANTARIPFLGAYFQPAYFIYIVRNGYAVAEGIRRRAEPQRWGRSEFGARYPLRLAAEQWVASDDVVSRDRMHAARLLDVRYEELTAAPVAVMQKITDFIGLEPLAPADILHEWRIHGVTSPIVNMNEKSVSRLTDEEKREIDAVAHATLRKYGYLSAPTDAAGRVTRP
jgi:hypothetical protein